MAERQFSEREVSEFIQQATALQLEVAEPQNGATLERIQRATSELGISPEHVRRAARQIESCNNGNRFQFFGAPLNIQISLIAKGVLTAEDSTELIRLIRSSTGLVGTPKQVGALLEWSSKAQYPIHMAFTSKDGRTYIEVNARYDSYALLLVLLPMVISCVAWLVPTSMLGGIGVLIWCLGQLGTYLIGRTLFRNSALKKRSELTRTANDLSEFVTQRARSHQSIKTTITDLITETETELSHYQ